MSYNMFVFFIISREPYYVVDSLLFGIQEIFQYDEIMYYIKKLNFFCLY